MKKIILAFVFACLSFIESKAVSFYNADEMSYDPDQLPTFDPSGLIINEKDNNLGRGMFNAEQNQEATISITIQNLSGAKQTVELFNAIQNMVAIENPSAWLYGQAFKPFSFGVTFYALAGVVNAADKTAERAVTFPNVIFYSGGNMIYYGTQTVSAWATTNTNQVVISCGQVPYQRLIEDLKDMVLRVSKIRMQYTTATGKNNDLRFVRNKSFAGPDNNSISPLTYFTEANFQANTVTIPTNIYIDKLTGIFLDVEIGETLTMNLFVTAYRNNGVRFN
jgi:hypothetical protein